MGKRTISVRGSFILILLSLCFIFPACSNRQEPKTSPYERIDYPDEEVMERGFFMILIDDIYVKRNVTINKRSYQERFYKYNVFFDEHGENVGVFPLEDNSPQGPIAFMMDYLTKGYVEADKELREALMTESRPSIPLRIYRDDPLFAKALFYVASRNYIFYWNINKMKVFSGKSYHYEHRYKLPPERYNVGW